MQIEITKFSLLFAQFACAQEPFTEGCVLYIYFIYSDIQEWQLEYNKRKTDILTFCL